MTFNPAQFRRRFIFVTKFKNECVEFVKRINEALHLNTAIAYIPLNKNDEKWYETNQDYCSPDFEKCCTYGVLVITHAMYILISEGKKQTYKDVDYRDLLRSNFHTLIVDEQIDNVKNSFFEFNLKKYEDIKKVLEVDSTMQSYFTDICKPFETLIKQRQKAFKTGKLESKYLNQLHYIQQEEFEFDCDELGNKLKALEGFNLDEQYVKDLKTNEISHVDNCKIKKFIEGVELLYTEIEERNVLINNNSLYTYDSSFQFFKLQNNIWLDASAKFHILYKLGENFHVQDTERVIDHSHSNLYIYWENTSTSHKNKELTKFRDEKTKFIKENTPEGSKVLIVTNKAECRALKQDFIDEEMIKKFESENLELTNFEDMRGKNNWGDFNYIYILQTPRMPFAYYVFLYEYWSGEKLNDEEVYCCNRHKKEYGFKNEELNTLMEMEITSVLYQTIKRIQRNSCPKGQFYMFVNITNVNNTVVKQLKNIKLAEKNKKQFKRDVFIGLIEEIRIGNYSEERIINKEGKKVKAVKKESSKYKVVPRDWVCTKLDVSTVVFTKDVKNKVNEADLRIKFKGDYIQIAL